MRIIGVSERVVGDCILRDVGLMSYTSYRSKCEAKKNLLIIRKIRHILNIKYGVKEFKCCTINNNEYCTPNLKYLCFYHFYKLTQKLL